MSAGGIRALRADEIEARVQTVRENGCSILLYKDARCDMRILDETFGITGWQRKHEVINGNLFCNVSVWDKDKEQWITKQDVGTESLTEKEKGQASDSFKRACFNIGIGRELYTAPFVWIKLSADETQKGNNGKLGVKTRFTVSNISYNANKEVNGLEIIDDKGSVRYSMGAGSPAPVTGATTKPLSEKQVSRFYAIAKSNGYDADAANKALKIRYNLTDPSLLTKTQYDEVCKAMEIKREEGGPPTLKPPTAEEVNATVAGAGVPFK